ncbi:MAG: hypothetical protein JWO56_1645, partial [Acidobacteria bacterium]|nr:hypothetical protein [Acidobacteriota bacterium]
HGVRAVLDRTSALFQRTSALADLTSALVELTSALFRRTDALFRRTSTIGDLTGGQDRRKGSLHSAMSEPEEVAAPGRFLARESGFPPAGLRDE